MKNAECNRNCWIVAGIAGVLVLLFTWGMGDLGFFGGLFLGLVACGLLGSLLVWLACNDRPELFSDTDSQTVTDWAREAADSQPGSLLVSGSLGPEPALMTMPIVAGAMKATDEDAGAKAETAHPAKAEPAKAPAKVEPAKAPAKASDDAEPAKAKAAPARKASQPTAADTPPDDLKRIKGIGPKLSEWLHENGITRYAQIAAWDADAVADYAERLGRMGGRIEADDWVGQARQLAEGGETEFSHRVDDGEVY